MYNLAKKIEHKRISFKKIYGIIYGMKFIDDI